AALQLLPGGGRLWMIGDSVRDIRAARAAQGDLPGIAITPIGIAGGRSSPTELRAAGAEQVTSSLSELAAAVRASYAE
ncbi:MAG: HAD hydrolase-like protein, partial [Myxococcota bacterium]